MVSVTAAVEDSGCSSLGSEDGSSLGLGLVVDEGSSGLMSLLLGVCSLIC